ncbi:MAG: TrmH family RNA methyltransferase [Balneola sp.]
MRPASNAQIKLLRKLSQRKYREKEGLLIVEGERAVEQVLENGVIEVQSVFVEEGLAVSFQLTDNSFSLPKKTFTELADTETPQGILAVCKIPEPVSMNKLQDLDSGVIVATDAIQDPGNLGTIIRTASWFGSKAILLGKGTVDIFNQKVVRSTAGATGVLPYLSGGLNEDLQKLEESGWNILLLDGNSGAEPISELPKAKKTLLVVGNEANGITPSLINPKRKRVLIPSNNGPKAVESLNAAVALSIALWSVHN